MASRLYLGSPIPAGAPPSGGGCPDGVTFDGANDWLARGGDLTGSADGRQGTCSFWVKFNGGDAAEQRILGNFDANVKIFRDVGNHLHVYLANAAFSISYENRQGDAYTIVAGAWHHVLVSWDMNFAAGAKKCHIYIDDAQPGDSPSDTGAAFDIDYTSTNWVVGVNGDQNGQYLNADLAAFWFAEGVYYDLTNATNRRKFITADLKAADLGADGSTPTGSKPIVYLNGPASGFQTNLGTGGNYTVSGALTDAATDPPCGIVAGANVMQFGLDAIEAGAIGLQQGLCAIEQGRVP